MKCPVCDSVDFFIVQADIFSALAECIDCGIRSVVFYCPYPDDFPELSGFEDEDEEED